MGDVGYRSMHQGTSHRLLFFQLCSFSPKTGRFGTFYLGTTQSLVKVRTPNRLPAFVFQSRSISPRTGRFDTFHLGTYDRTALPEGHWFPEEETFSVHGKFGLALCVWSIFFASQRKIASPTYAAERSASIRLFGKFFCVVSRSGHVEFAHA